MNDDPADGTRRVYATDVERHVQSGDAEVLVFLSLALGRPDWPEHVVIPTGNLGNLHAGLLDWRMGFPLGALVVATNPNDSLHYLIAQPRGGGSPRRRQDGHFRHQHGMAGCHIMQDGEGGEGLSPASEIRSIAVPMLEPKCDPARGRPWLDHPVAKMRSDAGRSCQTMTNAKNPSAMESDGPVRA